MLTFSDTAEKCNFEIPQLFKIFRKLSVYMIFDENLRESFL